MRTFVTLLVWSAILITRADDGIRIVRHGTNVTATPGAALATNLISYLQSCCVNSTAYAVKTNTWQELERSDSFVLLTFTLPRRLAVITMSEENFPPWEESSIDQILVPLPEDHLHLHIFAKSGTNVHSFTKMEPYFLKLIASEPALHLSSAQPYASLATIPPPKRWLTNGVWSPPRMKPD